MQYFRNIKIKFERLGAKKPYKEDLVGRQPASLGWSYIVSNIVASKEQTLRG
jgi:hypothetical protein